MIIMKECGRIFNRHRWKYRDTLHRICLKCGRTEGINHFGEWRFIHFQKWKDSVDSRKLMLKRIEESYKKGLATSKNKGKR